MTQAHVKDPSTLASLHPTEPRELHYRGYKNSIRQSGSHIMTLKRPSRQAESGREYVPGDPVSLIDWKAYARTDQLIVREIRDEASARVLIGVDLSAAMRWPLPDANGLPRAVVPSKAEVALRIAYNLAHVHLRMGDVVEIWLAEDEHARLPGKAFRPRSPADVVAAFEHARSAWEGPGPSPSLRSGSGSQEPRSGSHWAEAAGPFQPALLDERPRDVVFWVGDGLGGADFGAVLGRGKRSFFMHVLSSLELNIDWVDANTSYFDEGDDAIGRKEYQGQVLKTRDNYAKHLANWRQKLERRQRQRGGTYLTLSENTRVADYQAAVLEFIKQPNR